MSNMRRVTSLLPSWDRNRQESQKGTDRPWVWAENKYSPALFHHHSFLSAEQMRHVARQTIANIDPSSNKFGHESLWPTTLEKESEKAARILHSFCKDGFLTEHDSTSDYALRSPRPLSIIPPHVIRKAVGLAIFTAMRAGLWISGAGGSGVLMARKEDGDWSPPSGILLHTTGLSFPCGTDIYDCVIVINNKEALGTFTKPQSILGEHIQSVTGPLGIVGDTFNDVPPSKNLQSTFTYLKAHGFHADAQMNGTVIIERNDENERFYGRPVTVSDIMEENFEPEPLEVRKLMETAKASEGRKDYNYTLTDPLVDQPSPGDVDIHSSRSSSFGIPEAEDPDPFGVVALEKAGFEIRESGTRSRPSSSQFEYHPSSTSPIFARFNRMSIDTVASRSNRGSYVSTRTRNSTDRAIQTVEMGTQTEELSSPSISSVYTERRRTLDEKFQKDIVPEPEEVDYTKIDLGPLAHLSNRPLDLCTITESIRQEVGHETQSSHREENNNRNEDEGELELEEEEEEDEEPIIFEAASAQAAIARTAMNARGGLVDIPKRLPPPLPARSASRGSLYSSTTSPLKSQFEAGESRFKEYGSPDLRVYNPSRFFMPMNAPPLPELEEFADENSLASEIPKTTRAISS